MKIFNFSPGPAMMPIEVMKKAKEDFCNFNKLGVSVIEINHRSKEFIEIIESSERDLRYLLNIPDNYKILFCHGGARAQFSSIPMNLLKDNISPDYIRSGYWSNSAIEEAKKYCNPNVIDVTFKENNVYRVKSMKNWEISNYSSYIHYCPNETIDGIEIHELPNFEKKVVVADCSSMILSRNLDIKRFGVIYASSQKNIGPPGLALVIIRSDLLKIKKINTVPSILDYSLLEKNNSMFNTPSTFTWYFAGLVFDWLKKQGGLLSIESRNKEKSNLLYETIDKSDFYYNNISSYNRSHVNVPFRLANEKLNELFLKEAKSSGLYYLNGHRSVGGMRASLYNAMPIEGVKALISFMVEFSKRYG